jgi:alkylation response protein AidB-like acyl-CoA dehydrogenase
MDLRDSPSEAALRADLRAWLDEQLPQLPPAPAPEDWEGRRRYDCAWQAKVHAAGYAGIHWPVEYGGRGASPTEQLVFLEEIARAGAPNVGVNFVGLLHAGPTIGAEASAAQRAEHLPKILAGDEVWCQGFSEPDAGSDLASLRTKAVRDGDEYIVSGRKIWCSFAQVADWCELLVRTDPDAPKHKGITWLMLDMTSPGIEISPIRTALGSSEFSEVTFDEVRIPVANRVGAENDGWRVAMVTFAFERGTAFVGELVEAMALVPRMAELARSLGKWGDDGLRREIAHLAAELDGLWALTKRNVSQAARTGVPGPGGSVLKLHYSELRQRMGDLAMRLLGPLGWLRADVGGLDVSHHVDEQLRALALTIGAGTSQIQRNIVAERILGMPKER